MLERAKRSPIWKISKDELIQLTSDSDTFTQVLNHFGLRNVGSNYSRCHLKKRIITQKLIPYKCGVCPIKDIWNDKPLVLVLDHINGIPNDNRLENLRFLCPNCNSQTETFAGKNNRR